MRFVKRPIDPFSASLVFWVFNGWAVMGSKGHFTRSAPALLAGLLVTGCVGDDVDTDLGDTQFRSTKTEGVIPLTELTVSLGDTLNTGGEGSVIWAIIEDELERDVFEGDAAGDLVTSWDGATARDSSGEVSCSYYNNQLWDKDNTPLLHVTERQIFIGSDPEPAYTFAGQYVYEGEPTGEPLLTVSRPIDGATDQMFMLQLGAVIDGYCGSEGLQPVQ